MTKFSAAAENQREAARKRKVRAAGKVVQVRRLTREQKKRRKELEADDEAWLRYFFPELFWYEFTKQQKKMIAGIRRAITRGGDQAIAASRGEGKTTLAEMLALKHVLTGAVAFVLLLHSTGGKAQDSLAEIKEAIETNDRLAELYPEVCDPVRALENTPNRAHYQMVCGWRFDTGRKFAKQASRFSWCGPQVFLPAVPGSPSAKAIIATRGLDAEVRGVKKMGRRLHLAIIDDPDTEETINNEIQADKLEKRIDRGIAGSGGQQRPVARLMLTTLQRRKCVSAKFTDPHQKPSWQGQRFRFLVTKPARMDLWEEYVTKRQEAQIAGDDTARVAHQFYLDHRAEMDEGAEVANPNRFDPQVLPDGSQMEVSALQRYFNEVAKIGQEAVSTEYDNDPPEESGPQESGITASRVANQLSGFARKLIPPGCKLLTQGVDCHKNLLYWVIRAWKTDDHDCLVTGYTIDYGVTNVHGVEVGTDEGVDEAIIRALLLRRAEMDEAAYADVGGEIQEVKMTLVDARYKTEAVYEAVRQLGLGWQASMGFGHSNGCVQPNFSCPAKSTADKKIGDRWFKNRRPKGNWVVCMDTDFWKGWEHDRWMTDPAKPGALVLWGEKGDNPHGNKRRGEHTSYAKHITNETEVSDVVKGVQKRYWKAKSDVVHWLDTSYMSDVAASMMGVRLIRNAQAKVVQAGEWFKT